MNLKFDLILIWNFYLIWQKLKYDRHILSQILFHKGKYISYSGGITDFCIDKFAKCTNICSSITHHQDIRHKMKSKKVFFF